MKIPESLWPMFAIALLGILQSFQTWLTWVVKRQNDGINTRLQDKVDAAQKAVLVEKDKAIAVAENSSQKGV